ncbi:hypothetical protein NUM3379_29400 [Kineococcus sp. NUM-3379]
MLRARAARLLPAAGLLPLLLAALACLLSVSLPLAPVTVQTPEVRWPQAGQAPSSTVALFMPYRPLDLTAEVPCAALRALAARPGEEAATALGTALPGEPRGVQRALAVTVTGGGAGEVRVRSSAGELPDLAVVPAADPRLAGECTLRVVADQAGTRAELVRDGRAEVLGAAPGRPVPEVTAFVSDAPPESFPAVVAHPDARFESTPTALKSALLAAHGLLVAGCLLLLVRAAPRGPAPERTARPASARTARPASPRGRRTAAAVADVAVVGGLAGWAVAGPLQTDDFYYSLQARTIDQAGYVGNVVRYFNVPEIPFTLWQHVLSAFAAFSAAPVVLRLPALLAGLGTWLLLSRVVLPRLVQDPPAWVRPLAALALLAWYLPFAVGGRPEALVVLATTAALALVLEAIARRRLVLLGLAALVAGASVAITASGALAAVIALVLAPRWWPLLRESRYGVVASAALLTACASVAAPAVFADATLAAALTALRVHDEVGPNLSWWMEPLRYWYLTQGPDPNQRLFSRQLVVLVTLAVVVGVSTALLRSRVPAPARRTSWVVPAAVALAGYAVLALAPTKWSHHFGAVAGVGTLALVAGCVALVRRRPNRWACLGLAAAVAAVAGLALHGPDAQVELSAYGTVPELPGVLGLPPLWLALGAVAAGGVALRRRRRAAEGGPDAWPELVVLTTAGVLTASLVLQVLSVARATYVLRDTWSAAGSSLAALRGDGCGFADSAVALTGARALPEVPGAAQGAPERPQAPGDDPGGLPAGTRAWVPDPAGTQGAWHELGPRSASDALVVAVREPVAPVVVDLADAAGGSLGLLVVTVPPGEGWRVVRLTTLDRLEPEVARVRVNVSAGSPAGSPDQPAAGAVTDPWVATGERLSSVLPREQAVLVDWPIGFDLPCARPPLVAGGMVEPVEWVVQSATFEHTPMLTMIDGGGSYATLPTVATLTPYRGFLPGAPYREWGNLLRVRYQLPRERYDVVEGERTVPGWRWWDGAGPGPSPQEFLPIT